MELELVFGQFIGGIELVYQTNSSFSQSIAWTGSVLSYAEESFCCLVFTCVRASESVHDQTSYLSFFPNTDFLHTNLEQKRYKFR